MEAPGRSLRFGGSSPPRPRRRAEPHRTTGWEVWDPDPPPSSVTSAPQGAPNGPPRGLSAPNQRCPLARRPGPPDDGCPVSPYPASAGRGRPRSSSVGKRTADSPVSNGRCWIGTSDLLLVRRGTDDVIHGKKSSKFNWDCTICRSCRYTISDSSVLKRRGNRTKWRESGSQSVPSIPQSSVLYPTLSRRHRHGTEQHTRRQARRPVSIPGGPRVNTM